jgi:hypothetical protein
VGSAAADELIGRASQLRTDQIVGLATTTRRTIGRGVRGYLGLRSPALTTASLAAEAALKQVDLEDEMRTKVTALNEAVLSASMAAAEGRGRDTAGVREAWQRFQHAVDSEGRQERQRAFRSAKKAFRRGLGLQLARKWPMAGVGAAWALLALLTWDEATTDGPYTVADREILTRPWMSVSSLPT